MIRLSAPAFWYDPHANVTLLKPFAALWRAVTRHRLKGVPIYLPRAKVICIGNVAAGGTGKTPLAISVIEALREAGIANKPCFLTRGFGGHIKGPAIIEPDKADARICGDEALLLARHAPTIVAQDRAAGLRLADEKGFDFVIADDGFQNPNLAKSASILVFDGAVGIGNGYCIPAGPCREPLEDALSRASACVIVGEDKTRMRERLLALPTFAAHFKAAYNTSPDTPYIAFAGIGRPEKFFDTLRANNYSVINSIPFPDHHVFTASDIARLKAEAAAKGARLITTEKDFVRLPDAARTIVSVLPVTLKVDGATELTTLLRTKTSAP